MYRRFERNAEITRNKAALEEVRRLFERYRLHPRPAVERSATRKTKDSQRDAEARVERQTNITS